MNQSALGDIPGGQALTNWFGRVPRFHDAELLEVNLVSNGPSTLRVHVWQMTDKVDDKGYIVLDKHVTVVITLLAVSHVTLSDFNLPGIIFDLQVTNAGVEFQLTWSGSYGVEGTIRAQQMRIDFRPGKP
jgi:hypothetical protein